MYESYSYIITIVPRESSRIEIHVHYKDNCKDAEILDGILVALLCKFKIREEYKSTLITQLISMNILEETLKLFHSKKFQLENFQEQLRKEWIVDSFLLEKNKSRIIIN